MEGAQPADPLRGTMIAGMDKARHDLSGLAAYLGGQRESILNAWRAAARRDPQLVTGEALPRSQLNDHIPALLASFEDRLLGRQALDEPSAAAGEQAAAHGLHRWQQGYDLREVVRELGLLNEVMVAVLDAWAEAHGAAAPGAIASARREWAATCTRNIEESTAQYFALQRREAEGHARDLEQAVRGLEELERQRSALWRQLAHDLRGNVGVVASAALGLGMKGATDDARDRFLHMLDRNVGSLRNLLDDATDLARLHAGLEQRRLSTFDVTPLLAQLCDGLSAFARERGLTLRFEGPEAMAVEGDPAKLRRIAQNLILNALKFTRVGGVDVRWRPGDETDRKRWILTVCDTGPGLTAGTGAPLRQALEQATDLAQAVDDGEAPSEGAMPSADSPSPGPDHGAARPALEDASRLAMSRRTEGEGIGLSIVKRLSELLDATVEVESRAGQGTTFRVLFPRAYS